MKAGVLLFVVRDVTNYLEQNQMLSKDGDVMLTDYTKDAGLAVVIEQSLKQHGVDTPEALDKIVKILPLALQIVG